MAPVGGLEKAVDHYEFPGGGIPGREALKLLAYVSEKVPGCKFFGGYETNFEIGEGRVRLQDDKICGTVEVLHNKVLFGLQKGWDEKGRPRFNRMNLSTPGLDPYEVSEGQKQLIASIGETVNQYFLEKNQAMPSRLPPEHPYGGTDPK